MAKGSARTYRRIGALRSAEEFIQYLHSIDPAVPCDQQTLSAADGSPLAWPCRIGNRIVGNRFCIQPMEGWDGTPDGRPTEKTLRRWAHFGQSGAKLIWGGEAAAVRHDGRANPNQLCYRPENADALAQLLETLVQAHRNRFGPNADRDLLVGLQLTHSGRFSRPNQFDRPEPKIVYHHPLLDRRVGIQPDDNSAVLSDGEIAGLVEDFVRAAEAAQKAGFHFVDIKHCHGYLGHEFLSAYDRPGPYGGDFTGRTRFLRETIQAVRAACPRLMIGVRLSMFDFPPFIPDPARTGVGKLGPGIPQKFPTPYPGFGCDRYNPLQIDLSEPIRLVRMLRDELRVELVNLTAGSPYYNPHIQRPAMYPPSDGYQPPEDPLVGCIRQLRAAWQIKQAAPETPMVGSAYTYFQDFLPHVAQAVVRAG
ncbi:MAG TPA: NADH:flavin oxidoreductase, partial [Thermoguttaceae bacterium]|nr:NADH:flavin oxidoreductase [Thermoguttaceae bacterium]